MTERPAHSDPVFVIHAHSRPGVLAKITGAFDRRGLTICTLMAGMPDEAERSEIVVRVDGSRPELERVAAAIRNLIDVLSVRLSPSPPM